MKSFRSRVVGLSPIDEAVLWAIVKYNQEFGQYPNRHELYKYLEEISEQRTSDPLRRFLRKPPSLGAVYKSVKKLVDKDLVHIEASLSKGLILKPTSVGKLIYDVWEWSEECISDYHYACKLSQLSEDYPPKIRKGFFKADITVSYIGEVGEK